MGIPNKATNPFPAQPDGRHHNACRRLERFHDHVTIKNLFCDGTLEPGGGWVWSEEGPGKGLSLRTRSGFVDTDLLPGTRA